MGHGEQKDMSYYPNADLDLDPIGSPATECPRCCCDCAHGTTCWECGYNAAAEANVLQLKEADLAMATPEDLERCAAIRGSNYPRALHFATNLEGRKFGGNYLYQQVAFTRFLAANGFDFSVPSRW
jgi:hypothetical protein